MTISPDEAMNRVLLGLTTTPAPAGMEARIAARLLQMTEAQAASARTRSSWWLASAATAGIIITLAAASLILHHHQTVTLALQPRQNQPLPESTAKPNAAAQLRFALKVHPQTTSTDAALPGAAPATDYDAIALAETLAPSQSAAILPLTAQEQTLVQATRQGQPIEVAELDQVREPALRAAAAAREHRDLLRYASALLAPLAAFQSAEPDAPEDPQPSPDPNPQPQPLSPTASR
jgi:hypothetical protein